MFQIEQADNSADQKERLSQAITHYGDDFLPGHYDDWVLATREQPR